jgi:hypothetical protein
MGMLHHTHPTVGSCSIDGCYSHGWLHGCIVHYSCTSASHCCSGTYTLRRGCIGVERGRSILRHADRVREAVAEVQQRWPMGRRLPIDRKRRSCRRCTVISRERQSAVLVTVDHFKQPRHSTAVPADLS